MGYVKQYIGLSRCVYVVALSKLIQTIGAFIWPLFTIILTTKLGLSNEITALFVTISVVSGFAGAIIGGYISDHLGRIRSIVLFEVLATISFGATLLDTNGFAIASLLSFGMFFFSLAGPAHNSLLANVSKTEEKELAYSLHFQMSKIGVILGPVVGGMLLARNFRLFIILDVLTTLFGLVLLVTFVKEKKDKVGINPFERAVDTPLLGLLKDRPIVIYYALLSMFVAIIYGQMDYSFPIFIMNTVENGERLFVYLYSFNGFIVVGLTAVVTYLMREYSGSAKVLLGLLMYMVAVYSNVFVKEAHHFFFMMFVFSLGEIIISIGMGPKLSKMVPVNMYGKVVSFVQIFYVLGHLIATVVPVVLISFGLSYVEMWSLLGAFVFFGLIVFIYLQNKFDVLLGMIDSYDKNRK